MRPVGAGDEAAIGAVVAAAFGQPDEAGLVARLRAEGDVVVELVAEEAGEIVGHVLFGRLTTDSGAVFAALAPLSVTPSRQRDGLGLALMETGHALCAMAGVAAVVVLGHPDYYPRAGYSAEAARRITAPFSGPSFMALELTPGALAEPVAVTYAPAFGL
ncbi:MAG: GNAT family N-acetyltransferase [Caulobacter sp.]|nr:GNAT family N-acetyltransferase [Caulobacter sp.]